MATTYTSTVEFSVWKQHSCACCGTEYRYLLKRKVTGSGGTADAASRAAYKAAESSVEHDVDQQPCPGCGHYQPDMIAAKRKNSHWLLFWCIIPILFVVWLLAVPGLQILSFSQSSLITGITSAVFLVLHLLIDTNNPNKNLDANRALAQTNEKEGAIWIPPNQTPERGPDRLGNGWTGGHTFGYLVLIVATLMFLAPYGMSMVMQLSRNPAWMPEVAGPGEEVYIYFPEKVKSVGNHWRASGRATVVNAQEVGLAGGEAILPVTSRNDNWGASIRVKSSEKHTTSSVWATVRLPANAAIIGKTLQIKIDLLTRFPALMGNNQFQETDSSMTMQDNFTVSTVGSGGTYRLAWWIGLLGGTAVALIGSGIIALMAGGFSRQARPTQVFVPNNESEGAPEEETSEAANSRENDPRIRSEEPRLKREQDDY